MAPPQHVEPLPKYSLYPLSLSPIPPAHSPGRALSKCISHLLSLSFAFLFSPFPTHLPFLFMKICSLELLQVRCLETKSERALTDQKQHAITMISRL